MAKKQLKTVKRNRRMMFTQEFKQQAVQMLLDGYSASSVSENLGIGNTNLVYRWKAEQVSEGGPVAESLAFGAEGQPGRRDGRFPARVTGHPYHALSRPSSRFPGKVIEMGVWTNELTRKEGINS